MQPVIWYIPKEKKWAIGSLDSRGTDIAGIKGKQGDAPSLPYKTFSWNYYNALAKSGQEWKESSVRDTSVKCVVGNAYHQK